MTNKQLQIELKLLEKLVKRGKENNLPRLLMNVYEAAKEQIEDELRYNTSFEPMSPKDCVNHYQE